MNKNLVIEREDGLIHDRSKLNPQSADQDSGKVIVNGGGLSNHGERSEKVDASPNSDDNTQPRARELAEDSPIEKST